jgi:putative transposon-encoded protein
MHQIILVPVGTKAFVPMNHLGMKVLLVVPVNHLGVKVLEVVLMT